MDTEIGTSYNFYLSQKSLFDFSSQLYKNIKTILSSQAIWKQTTGWIWPTGHGLITPRMHEGIGYQ